MHWPFLPFLLQFAMGNYTQNWIKHETDCCKNRTFYSSFFVPKREKGSGRNGKSKPHQSSAILSQRWWAVHPQHQIQSIRHEEYVCVPAQASPLFYVLSVLASAIVFPPSAYFLHEKGSHYGLPLHNYDIHLYLYYYCPDSFWFLQCTPVSFLLLSL